MKPIETVEEYEALLAEAETLIPFDPEADSPSGIRLLELVGALEEYEKKMFPFLWEE